MSFIAPEVSTLPRFHKRPPQVAPGEEPPTEYRSISPPRSRSSSINATTEPTSTTSSKLKSATGINTMSNLFNKVKAKMADHPNAVPEDYPHKPSSGVQDPPEDATRSQLGQGHSHRDEQDVRFGSITDEYAAGTTAHSSVAQGKLGSSEAGSGSIGGNFGQAGGAGPEAAQQAVRNVDNDGRTV